MILRLRRCRDGFAATYFLAFLLYICSVVFVFISNDISRIRTIENMKMTEEYMKMETAVITDIKCRIMNDKLNEETVEMNAVSYRCVLHDSLIYVEIYGIYYEQLTVSFDPEQKMLLDYTAVRDVRDDW